MPSPEISVIVPVYNASKYLHRCVDSILAQTFCNFELLLVNDGSTDDSGGICDEYANIDCRIKVIHKENGGVASARQCGIDNAIGKYTIHADPDDWVDPNMLAELLQQAVDMKSDMVICDYWENYSDREVYIKQQPSSLVSHDIIRDMFHGLHGSTWNKLILRKIYVDNHISFNTKVSFCEDLLVCMELLSRNIKVSYLPKAFYHYDQYSNENSLVKKSDADRMSSRIIVLEELEKVLPSGFYDDELYRRKAILKTDAFASGVFEKKNICESIWRN
jgi:glycosyltransferase involved in cell wall biosynthesis